jgi:hypothetical protein
MDDKEDQLDVDTITIDIPEIDLSSLNYSIDMSSSSSYYYSNVTLNGAVGASGSILTSAGMNGSSWGTVTTANPGLHVKDDATFEGDIKWKGRSLEKLLQSIEDRLAILQEPNPAKLEKYAALKKAYDHYKTLERLIGED